MQQKHILRVGTMCQKCHVTDIPSNVRVTRVSFLFRRIAIFSENSKIQPTYHTSRISRCSIRSTRCGWYWYNT